MIRYKAYSAYRDSGVEWVGHIPMDWDMWKINHACPYVASGTTPTSDSEIYYGGDFPWVTTGELRENLITDTQKKVSHRALSDMPTLRLHPKGSVAIAMYGATIGRLGIFGINATTNQACCVMPPSKILHNKYLFYWLYATRQEIINLSVGGGQPNVNQEKIASLKVSAPNYFLQEKIAAFLDHETAKIDALIEKQQRLIELLKEKRQAVISHAVTKGLNPNAPMKDSGVEWLGEVPAHWEVMRLKHLATNIKAGPFGSAITKDMYVSAGYRVYGQEQVIPEDFSIGDYYISAETFLSLNQYKVTAGDILISCVGTFGKIAVVPPSIEPGIINPRLIRFQCNEHITPSLLAIVLRSAVVFAQFAYLSRGGTMDVINIGTLSEINIVVPPLNEQEELVAHVTTTSTRFDALIGKADSAISLLQERRTALISAAVTGKIDVRDWQAAA